VVQQLNLALGRLIVEVSRSHTHTHTPTYSAGLLKTSDQLVAWDASDNAQHTQETNIYALNGIRTHNPAIERQHNFDLHRTATEIGSQHIRGSVSS
jgi:hypothetical protein